MALERFANTPTPAAPSTPWTTLNGAITSGALSLTVTSASAFPSLAQFRVLIDSEWLLITAGAGTTTWTVTRGAEGSTPTAHAHGASIFHVLTAAALLRNPRSMTTLGDMEYMAADLGPARLAAPTDGDYVTRWTSGVPSWIVASGGGTPGGSDGEVQFNDGGAFGGSNKLTFNKTTGALAFPTTAKSFSHSTAIDLTQTYTGVANDEFLNPFLQLLTVDPSSGSMAAGAVYGAFLGVFTGTANVNYLNIYGLYQDVEVISAGSVTSMYSAKYDVGRGGSGSVTNIYGALYSIFAYDSATIANAYGAKVNSFAPTGTATIDKFYAFHVGDLATVATHPYYFWGDSRGVYRIREDNVADGSGNPQAIPSLYNPRFTKYVAGAVDYERSIEQWVNNVLQIGAEKGGTGTLRGVTILGASLDTPATLTANGVAVVTTSGAQALTNKTGNISQWTNDVGYITSGGGGSGDVVGPSASVDHAITRFDGTTGKLLQDYTSGAPTISDTGSIALAAGTSLGWSTDLFLFRGAANILEQRNSTAAQSSYLYNTYTDASNWEALKLTWISNSARLFADAAGSGTFRNLRICYGGAPNDNAIQIPTAINSPIDFGSVNLTSSVAANGRFAVARGAVCRATSGTHFDMTVAADSGGANPTSTSTLTYVGFGIKPTINYSAGTPGAGSYEALKIAVTETALPTGTNFLVRASAGAAGATDKFTVKNNGDGFFAGTLSFGTHTGLGIETVTGYITVTDAGGATRKLAVVS